MSSRHGRRQRVQRLIGVLLLVVGGLSLPTRAVAALFGDPAAQVAYDQGVDALRAGDAAGAERGFRGALQAGAIDQHAYHGLGNALYRQGELGLAIAAWNRALVLAPANADVTANLERARRDTRDRLEVPQRSVGPFFWQASLSTGTTALASGVLAAVALVSLVPAVLRRSAQGRSALPVRVAAVCGTGALLLALSTALAASAPPTAVVRSQEATARSALGPAGVDLFVLHEGAEVRVDEQAELGGLGYALVVLPDARKGWLPLDTVVIADPDSPFPPS